MLKDKTKEKNSVKNKKKLTRSEKKQIAELIRKAKPDKKASSSQVPSSPCVIIMCPVEDTGKNSVNPSTMAIIIASNHVIIVSLVSL